MFNKQLSVFLNILAGDVFWLQIGSLVPVFILALELYGQSSSSIIRFESIAWIPNIVAFVVMLGVGGKHLNDFNPSVPSTLAASTVTSFGSVVGAWIISWCTLTPDYGVYHERETSR